jgi:PTS system ascorbate-specific IIA component
MAEKTVLQRIVERGHFRFVDSVDSWEEAVRLCCEPLVETGYTAPDYYKQIVDCVKKYGPYMVFDHYVAMPHSQKDAKGAYKTAVGLMVVKNMVDFGTDADGEKKEAKLFFPLVAVNPEEHLENMQQLMEIFMNEPLLDALMEAESGEDILKAEAEHPMEEDDF